MTDSISLRTSDGSTDKKFWASRLTRTARRAQTVEEMAGGRLSVSSGKKRDVYAYILFVAEEPADPDYGSVADLRKLFSLNNPSGSPSDVITLTRHDGVELDCRMLGDMPDDPYTVILEGETAYYEIPIELADITMSGLRLDRAANSMFIALF
ncbi:MAG: hypothetical protein JW910_21890 [Anaerolineae bacterium]|nr:hypothetical protein [Anaerolineae bacterium]